MGLKDRIPRRGTLGRKAMNAAMWSLVQIVAANMLRLMSNLIMTRILAPDAFGLMAMVFTVQTALILFSDIGIDRSIIREPDGEDPHFLQVAWTVKLIRGALVALCVVAVGVAVWLFAPGWARPGSVYADPRLPMLIVVSALTPLLNAADSSNKYLTTRRMENWRFTVIGISSQFIVIPSMIAYAWLISPSVWALLIGALVGNVFGCVASHLFYRGPWMKFAWDEEIVDRLWKYGRWLIGSSIFTFIATQADKFILGSLFAASTFGLYIIAQIWIQAGKTLIGRMSDRVGFPAISEVLRNRPRELPRLFGKFQRVIDAFCVTAFLVTWLGGQWLITFLYTPEYAEAGRFLSLLSISFLVMRFDTLGSTLLNLGHTRAVMIVSASQAVAMCAFLPLGYWLSGVDGAILGGVLSGLGGMPYSIRLLRKPLGERRMLINTGWFAATVVMAGVVYLWH